MRRTRGRRRRLKPRVKPTPKSANLPTNKPEIEDLRGKYERGICPNGRRMANITWSSVKKAHEIAKRPGQLGGGMAYGDFNGDGKIDIADIVYFIN